MKILKEAYHYWGAEGLVVRFTYAMLVGLTHILRSRFHHLELHREFRDHAGLHGIGDPCIRHVVGLCGCHFVLYPPRLLVG